MLNPTYDITALAQGIPLPLACCSLPNAAAATAAASSWLQRDLLLPLGLSDESQASLQVGFERNVA